MVKYLIFDLDDTLYCEREFVYSGFRNVASFLGEKYGYEADELYNVIINIFQEKGRGKIFDELCQIYSFNENAKLLVEIYRSTKPKLELYPDAASLLTQMKGRYGLGVVTDGEARVQWNKIQALGLHRYMDKIIVTDDYGREFWKPSVRPFQEMINYFGGNANEYVYVGDNPKKDFIGPRELGMNTIRIVRKIGDFMDLIVPLQLEADYTMETLMQVNKILNFID